MRFANGNIYEGELKNGLPEGKGIYMFANGDAYEGEFKNNNFEGEGIFIYANDDIYGGKFKNNKKEGKGIYIFGMFMKVSLKMINTKEKEFWNIQMGIQYYFSIRNPQSKRFENQEFQL